jgi:general secretion pathway protein G
MRQAARPGWTGISLSRWVLQVALIIALALLFDSVQAGNLQTFIPEPEQGLTPEQRTTRLDLKLLTVILTDHIQQQGPMEDTGRLVPLRDLVDQLPADHAGRLPMEDGWGGEYYFMVMDGQMAFASKGPDGRPDGLFELFLDPPEKLELPRGLQAELIGDDIIQLGDEIFDIASLERGRQKRTMADLRSIATAMEEYAIDNNEYPGDTDGLVDVSVLVPSLCPIYIRTLPEVDGWGERILVWSTEDAYLLVSTGSDHRLDDPYLAPSPKAMVGGGAFTEPWRDLLFANGTFIQWPEESHAD